MKKILINKKMIACAAFALAAIICFLVIIKMSSSAQEQNVLSDERMRSELQSVSEYLNELDSDVLENQDKVQAVINAEKENFATMLEQLTTLQNIINDNNTELSAYMTEYRSDNSNLNTSLQVIQEQLNVSYDRIDAVELNITDVLENMNFEISDRFSRLDLSIKEVSESLENVETNILDVLNEMEKDNKIENEKLRLLLTNIQESLSVQIQDNMQKITNTFNAAATEIQNKLKELHSQIQQTQADISDILIAMNSSSAQQHNEILTRFENVDVALKKINSDLQAIYEDIRNLILHLENQGQENHTETISLLSDMEVSIQDELQNKLLQINTSFQSLTTDMNERFNSLAQGINSNFSTVTEQMQDGFVQIHSFTEEKANALQQGISATDQNTQTGFTTLKDILALQEESLILYLDAQSNELEQQLNLLFQSVSNGKINLASALLTKGVSINQDASFNDFMQAILNIKQELLVGIEKLPGEISYDYHYHIDGNGNELHTNDNLAEGGCYTIPVYHVHISSCYSTRNCGGRAEQRTYMVQGCNCGPQLGGGTRCGKHGCSFDPPSPQYPSGSARCNCPKATAWFCTVCGAKGGGSTCYSPKTVLVCPKNGNSIDKYSVGCKLNDGQIIAAHIVYTQTNAVSNQEIIPEYIPPAMEDEIYTFIPDEPYQNEDIENLPPEQEESTIIPPAELPPVSTENGEAELEQETESSEPEVSEEAKEPEVPEEEESEETKEPFDDSETGIVDSGGAYVTSK